jgi:hypothetical protein
MVSVYGTAPVLSAVLPENYTHEQLPVNEAGSRQLKPSVAVALYPMSVEDISAIEHIVPMVPVNVDGSWYEAEEITLFNGQRLFFTLDRSGGLYAFTSAVEMEAFLVSEYGDFFSSSLSSETHSLNDTFSTLYENWMYGGWDITVAPFARVEALSGYMNNAISSAIIGPDAPLTLWEYANYQGNGLTIPAGSAYYALALYGWNDRASSIS